MMPSRHAVRRTGLAVLATTLLTPLASCSLVGGGDDEGADGRGEVVLLTHSSFVLPDELVEDFEAAHDVDLVVRQPGDAGAVVTEISLNPDDAGADVVFGVDNTFASRVLEADALLPYDGELPAGADAFALEGEDRLVPVDTGNVCVNVDTAWFAEQGISEPETLEDLADPAYAGLFVTPGPVDSSPGLAFLLATVAEFGEDGWEAYWERLLANDALVVDGWTDAYYGDFTATGENPTRPIVVSYDSSPAFTLSEDGASTTTRALLDTCYTQVEYAGVLRGADHEDVGRELVDWLLSPEVQAALPESMYVFPVAEDAELPADWASFAERPTAPYQLEADVVAAGREEWIARWRDLAAG
ncbi:thiamine ABC transporter substrate-binding protein [Nocardioides sp. CPCC 205120]|uniref:thiamine ABC transporter substrate-binding protein n=1 Tax=Nocardioides sp. CPCC 205120 TaxID=3406462 RepID=UPI003B515173